LKKGPFVEESQAMYCMTFFYLQPRLSFQTIFWWKVRTKCHRLTSSKIHVWTDEIFSKRTAASLWREIWVQLEKCTSLYNFALFYILCITKLTKIHCSCHYFCHCIWNGHSHPWLITLGLMLYFFVHVCSTWLYDVCRGREFEPVRPRQLSKSCGCGKNFLGKSKLISKKKVRYWMFQFASELSDRLKSEVEKV
jgi:hypothetical protein